MKAIAYVDEAGAKGMLNNLTETRDAQISVISALVLPRDNRDYQTAFTVPFERFKQALPNEKARLHITDAFTKAPDGSLRFPAWAEAARLSREEIFALIETFRIPIVYDARRLGVARATHEMSMKMISQARRLAGISTMESSEERVEESMMIGLALKLDAFAEDFSIERVDLHTDHLDEDILRLFEASVDATRKIVGSNVEVAGKHDPSIVNCFSMTVRNADGSDLLGINARFLGDLVLIGKHDPLIFAADVVANFLHYYLKSLDENAPLNSPASISGWRLGHLSFGHRQDAFEDLI